MSLDRFLHQRECRQLSRLFLILLQLQSHNHVTQDTRGLPNPTFCRLPSFDSMLSYVSHANQSVWPCWEQHVLAARGYHHRTCLPLQAIVLVSPWSDLLVMSLDRVWHQGEWREISMFFWILSQLQSHSYTTQDTRGLPNPMFCRFHWFDSMLSYESLATQSVWPCWEQHVMAGSGYHHRACLPSQDIELVSLWSDLLIMSLDRVWHEGECREISIFFWILWQLQSHNHVTQDVLFFQIQSFVGCTDLTACSAVKVMPPRVSDHVGKNTWCQEVTTIIEHVCHYRPFNWCLHGRTCL